MLLQRQSNQLRDVAIRADDDGGRASPPSLPLSAHAPNARSERRRLAEWVLRRCQPPLLYSLRGPAGRRRRWPEGLFILHQVDLNCRGKLKLEFLLSASALWAFAFAR